MNAFLTRTPDKPMTLPYRIDAVLFDFDGTLTRPGSLDFSVIKQAIGCPHDVPVLEFMAGVDDPAQRLDMARQLDRFELDGAAASQPNVGAEQLVDSIKAAGLPVGILTRNSRASVARALENFSTLRMVDIDVMVTREDPVKIKPSGEGVLLAARNMGVDPAHVLVVGDFSFDVLAGREAGSLTAYLSNGRPVPADLECRFVVETLFDLEPILVDGVSLPAGKLPNAFLGELLERCRIEDPSVIVGPSVGEDTAAVDIDGEKVLVLKTDPITFATESIGQYAVLVNANDLATAGADARWMLATLLLPCGFSRNQVRRIFDDLYDACTAWGITLCGGHTEITDAVCRPVVTGMMAGTIARNDLIRKNRMAPGDRVLVTKGVAVEGTAIIAAEFRELLLEKGMTPAEIDDCSRFQSMISILPEARIAWTRRRGLGASRCDRGWDRHGPDRVEPGRRLGNAHPARYAAGLSPDTTNGGGAGHRSIGTHRIRQPARLLPAGPCRPVAVRNGKGRYHGHGYRGRHRGRAWHRCRGKREYGRLAAI